MDATVPADVERTEKHEEILRKRAELLEQTEKRKEKLKILRKQRMKECEDARERNAALLQDLQKIEDGLRGRPLPHPNLLALQTRYWASVEASVPAWEQFLLGKALHPVDGPGQRPMQATQRSITAKDRGLPPLPKAKQR